MTLPEHTKIINSVARYILKPHGLNRKGQSRIWLDDQGWYTIVVEFQPFGFSQGTCLNVGVNFLWYPQDYFSFDIGYRESSLIDLHDTDQFTSKVERLALLALDKVHNYRESLITLQMARKTILDYTFTSEDLWGNYHKGTICGLVGDQIGLCSYYEKLLSVAHDVPWANELKVRTRQLMEESIEHSNFVKLIQSYIVESRKLKRLKDLAIDFK
jgi:hypothetical protein